MLKAHDDFLATQILVYEPNGLICQNILIQAESHEYGALDFEINNIKIKYRVAKITATKVGQFVTLWKRDQHGITVPYDLNDQVDLFVISVRDVNNFGQFVFHKNILHKHGYVSSQNIGGKRAMRVYPPWVVVNNPQAIKTQAWQLAHYFEISPNLDNGKIVQKYNILY